MKDRKRITEICLLLLIPLLLFYGCGQGKQDENVNLTGTAAGSQSSATEPFDSTRLVEETSLVGEGTADRENTPSKATEKPGPTAQSSPSKPTSKPTDKTVPTTQSSASKPTNNTGSDNQNGNSVSMLIQCKEAVEYMKANPEKTKAYDNIVPADGIMLNQSNIQLQQGDTVLDILKRVTKQEEITLIEKGGYVSNIGGLAEKAKAFGEQSGWLYSVNGVIPPNTGVAAYQVKEGDKIELLFVTKRTSF
ncbi:MAG TPA: DUF4430 domain-containing protein [Clostridia bacterium]|nr:DUF4430 domain-containing protein [Clostridia bacterium]